MRPATPSAGVPWDELFDRDIERLLAGRPPDNQDLAPLASFVSALAAFRDTDPPEDFVEDISNRAAQIARDQHSRSAIEKSEPRARRFGLGLKRRAVTGLTGLMIISGLTGVAWASDEAVPGDWNYGIDRAVEAVGIGSGGDDERLQELVEIQAREVPSVVAASNRSPKSQGPQPPTTSPEITKEPGAGLIHAADAVIQQGSENSVDVRKGVSALLTALLQSGEIDAATIAEMARNLAGNPDNPSRPDDPGKPDDPGRP